MEKEKDKKPKKKTRWEEKLTDAGKDAVERVRRVGIAEYEDFVKQGFLVAEEVSEFSGRVLRRGREWKIEASQNWAAQEAISILQEQDDAGCLQKEYRWTVGAVLPRRRVKIAEIAQEQHVRLHPHGITIFERMHVPQMQQVHAAHAGLSLAAV